MRSHYGIGFYRPHSQNSHYSVTPTNYIDTIELPQNEDGEYPNRIVGSFTVAYYDSRTLTAKSTWAIVPCTAKPTTTVTNLEQVYTATTNGYTFTARDDIHGYASKGDRVSFEFDAHKNDSTNGELKYLGIKGGTPSEYMGIKDLRVMYFY